MPDKPTNPEPDALTEILARLERIEELLSESAKPERRERPDDLVDAAYVAERLHLVKKTVVDGKAGTSALPRFQSGHGVEVLFLRRDVDKFIAKRAREAEARLTPLRVRKFLLKRSKRSKRAA